MSSRGRLVVISGPSGAGKTTISRELVKVPGFERVVTCTTRAPRGKERDGVDYHFLARDEFARRVREGYFLEHAEVHGHCYGTPRDGIEAGIRRGTTLILAIDVQGARQLREAGLDRMTTVFVEAPDMTTLKKRLARRGTESEDEIGRRLEEARVEMNEAVHYDHVVVNRDLELAISEILRALEDARESRRQSTV